ncbi:alpha/beta fold hydrolase [Paenibacillus arenilitoris]|uniref:Alpha/beta hydrolase n=1 Tax=Paenibacillus arenilitoris TaxID=2772299 RepID=A0A927H6K7_9BACL|nr:alpha/beta hydrolase [Paenibacillus arenilitoris]MBD2868669.1 alpha/beta hydrolase [Paenibacillus arenilitoris]
MIKHVTLNDGSKLEVQLAGDSGRKVVMLPTAKKSVSGQEAANLKRWGVDPELGKNFVEGLSDTFQVLHFDYEGHLFEHPQPDRLTPDNITQDFLRIADEMRVEKFSYYGYSWLALVGLQLAIRTKRMESLIMGGFPPYEGPYREMMTVTTKTYLQAINNTAVTDFQPQDNVGLDEWDWDNVQVQLDPNQTKQFFTLYGNLMDFDDKFVLDRLDLPKLTFAGEKDTIVYGENFGSVTVDIVGLLRKHEAALKRSGWDVRLIAGTDMDHTKAMQPEAVLPLIKPWLVDKLLR